MRHPALRFARAIPLLVLATLAGSAPSAKAAEVTLFVSGATPGLAWKGGVGGAFGLTLFGIVGLELEGAHQSGEVADSGLLTLAGRAYLGPSIGRLVPYAGLSAGTYRATLGPDDDWGTSSGVFVGAKLKLGLGLLVRGEYQWTHFPDGALVPMDSRYSAGLSLSF